KQPFENLLIVEKQPAASEKPAFVADRSLAEKGKAIFASAGCASCHQMKAGNETLASQLSAPALAALDTASGCLSAAPAKGAPRYSLSDAQRTALAAGITSLK